MSVILASVKKAAKRLFRPLSTRVRARLDLRLQPIEARLAALENGWRQHLPGLLNGWRQHLPGLLNAVSSIAAFGYELASLRRETQAQANESREQTVAIRHEFNTFASDHRGVAERVNAEITNLWKSEAQAARGIGELWQRLEFVRREIMYEFKYGVRSATATPDKAARILAPDKIEKARAVGIRLNLGCGHVPLDGYINVDQRELPGVDIVTDAGNLPFEEHSLSEIFSAHVLEHIPQERLRRLLPYWRSLLGSEGTFRAVVPDGEAMLAAVAAGNYSFEHFREVLFGAQEYEGDFHFNLFTPDSLSHLLVESGLKEVTVPIKGCRNGNCFEFEIRASRG